MKTTHPDMSYIFFTIIIIILSTIIQIKSEEYTVGDDDEWTTGVNYYAWSQKYHFAVGDIIVFKYVPGQHNTYEVTEDTYRSCNTSTGVLNIYESGNDQVSLRDVKKYWFICNVPGHCSGGMRFGIDVTKASSSPPSPAPEITPPPNTGDKLAQGKGIACALLGAFGTYFFIY
ncbi:hypothetical protein IFM89_027384 [Coptis chinensis]|uniref:Phytocyanin domain-containing protein n=1 Tax=Coptis chinensis TaxID=261450 RepID=A0A835H9J3_9MAGN|nr:hypothetical protein IFM89_027384 [Coptis chinensis]